MCEDRTDPTSKVIVRKINLETCNAGKDDGLPTSVLREMALVQKLECEQVAKIIDSQVLKSEEGFGKTLVCVYPFQEFNLREFVRNYGRPLLDKF